MSQKRLFHTKPRVKVDSRLNEFAKNRPASAKSEKLKKLASKMKFKE